MKKNWPHWWDNDDFMDYLEQYASTPKDGERHYPTDEECSELEAQIQNEVNRRRKLKE